MNIVILKKCVEELSKDNPDLSYIRGMLETIIALNETQIIGYKTIHESKNIMIEDGTLKVKKPIIVPAQSSEASMLDAQAASKLANVMQAAKLE